MPDAAFELHPQLAADTHPVGDLPLCRVLLMDDANWPWVILVPRRPDLREICELSDADQHTLIRESSLVASNLIELFNADKLNVAALGNQVPQLHLHHIVRHTYDPAWPKPVWGALPRQPYAPAKARETVKRLAFQLGLPYPA
jgi:diadenosine tetraphosphate (Ap4A) HIT family hydrolase